jgi:two-component sensor histidine kinase
LSVSPLRDESGRVIGASKIARDITDRHRAFEQQQLLLKEMAHRIKNVFSIASGLISLCARRAQTPEELSKMARERLDALTRAHALTAPRPDSGAENDAPTITLHELLQTIVSPHLDAPERSRFTMLGEDLSLSSKALTPIALAVNELTTNAVKYGALSSPDGAVTFELQSQDDLVILRWTERGGPLIVAPPDHVGFGTRLSEMTVGQLGGTIRRDWNKEGLSATIVLKRSLCDLLHGQQLDPV